MAMLINQTVTNMKAFPSNEQGTLPVNNEGGVKSKNWMEWVPPFFGDEILKMSGIPLAHTRSPAIH